MRTIILGLSACLSACVAAVPVAELDYATGKDSVIPVNELVETEQDATRHDAAPPEIRFAQSYAINLESAEDRNRLDQVPTLLILMLGLDDHLVYTSNQTSKGRISHHLRLGFFGSRAEAEAVRTKLSAHYPQAWITKTTESERIAARQYELRGGIATSSPLKAESVISSATTPVLDAPADQRMGMPVVVKEPQRLDDVHVRAIQGPESELYRSTDPGDRLRLGIIGSDVIAVKPQNEPRVDAETQVTYGREEDESVFVKTDFKGGDLFTVGASFTRKKQVGDFEIPLEEERGFWHMKMSSAAGGPGSGFEAEFAQSSFDPDTSEGFGAAENRLIRLSTNRAWRGFSLGLGYRSVGEKFEFGGKTANGRKKSNDNPKQELQKDQQGTEAWVARQFGNLGVKTLASVYQDNLEGDDNVPRFTTHKVGGSLNYMISSWPSVSVTLDYMNGARGSSDEPNGVRSMQVGVENIASSLDYSDDTWSGTLYVENATGEGTTNVTNLRTYWLGGSYFPASTFSVTPSVSYVKEAYPQLDVNTDSFAASMTLSYKPSTNSRFDFTGYSEYSTEKNRDWEMDSEYMYSSLGINWNSRKEKSLIKKWSLELFHDQYTDNLYSDNSVGGVGFMLKLRSSKSPRPSLWKRDPGAQLFADFP